MPARPLAFPSDPPKKATSAVDPADCADCFGTGWLIEPDGGAGRAVRCHCFTPSRKTDRFERAGIPSRYRRSRLRLFNTANPNANVAAQLLRARSVSERYVEGFVNTDGSYRRSGLLYVGPPGVGKTHLATAVLIELMERYGVGGRFVDFSTLLHQIQSTFDAGSAETKSSILKPIIEADIVVLDELGAQKPTDWVMDVLYLIMNTRYTEGRPTIFTTNYRLEDVKAPGLESLSRRISASLLSRLYEMAHPLDLDGPDYRKTVKMHENPLAS
ncbi:MAG: ATP-binding protein [Acidobacteriota bacterium]